MRDVQERIAGALGAPVRRLEQVRGGGYTLSDRFRVHLDGGDTAFAKVATTEPLAEWFRLEHRLYREIAGPFMPELLGFDDDGTAPILLLEDLSDGIWPPPWPDGGVQAVVSALEEVHATPPPEGLPAGEEWRETLMGWEEVSDDPEPFLSVGIVSREWLVAALPTLRAAATEARLAGDALLHLDVRSDNICLYRGRAYLVDWNWATVGNPLLDLAAWLPSLHAEGGPRPEDVMGEGAAELARCWRASSRHRPANHRPGARRPSASFSWRSSRRRFRGPAARSVCQRRAAASLEGWCRSASGWPGSRRGTSSRSGGSWRSTPG